MHSILQGRLLEIGNIRGYYTYCPDKSKKFNEKKLEEMDRKIDKMEAKLETLCYLAERGRGGFWMGMLVVSVISTVTGWAIHWFSGK